MSQLSGLIIGVVFFINFESRIVGKKSFSVLIDKNWKGKLSHTYWRHDNQNNGTWHNGTLKNDT
jgi:hypothetical protein